MLDVFYDIQVCLQLAFYSNCIWSMQMLYLDDWHLIDRDHSSSLSGIVEALEASTLRLPVGGGARVCACCLEWALVYYHSIHRIYGALRNHFFSSFFWFFTTGRYSKCERCYLFSSWCDAGNGILDMLFVDKGNLLFFLTSVTSCCSKVRILSTIFNWFFSYLI